MTGQFIQEKNLIPMILELLDSLINLLHIWERSGSVVECLTRDRGAAGSSLTGVTVLCP